MHPTLESLSTAAPIAAAAIAVVLLLVAAARRFLIIGQPDELLVLSGRKRRAPDGSVVGYRVVHGGRVWRWPIVETVDRMDLSILTVPMSMRGAYSEGGIPLELHAVANVKVSSDLALVGNAIERFLGHQRSEIARVAKETLEGHLRGVIATMTPEEVNEDRLKFAERLAEEAGADLAKLGLQLDVLKIQAVSDERSYLDSIGRKRIAEILRDAQVAESDAARSAEESEARAKARGTVARKNAEAVVARRENALRTLKAELSAQIEAAEQRAEQAALAARAEAERELQTIRAEVEKRRLQADVVAPAQAHRQAEQLLQEGAKASIAIDGRAIGESLAAIGEAWKELGDDAMDMVLVQHLESIFEQVTDAAGAVHADGVELIDAGDGKTIAGYVSAYPATVGALLEQLEAHLGLDVRRLLRGEPSAEGPTTESPTTESGSRHAA